MVEPIQCAKCGQILELTAANQMARCMNADCLMWGFNLSLPIARHRWDVFNSPDQDEAP